MLPFDQVHAYDGTGRELESDWPTGCNTRGMHRVAVSTAAETRRYSHDVNSGDIVDGPLPSWSPALALPGASRLRLTVAANSNLIDPNLSQVWSRSLDLWPVALD